VGIARYWRESGLKAAVITAPDVIEIETIDDPTPGPHDVVVEVAATGLCGTDLLLLAGHHAPLPVVPGHELAGTVVAVGREIRHLRAGDRVAIDPNVGCGHCRECRRGRANLCDSLEAIGISRPGGAAEYASLPGVCCAVLPESVDVMDATLVEPLSCAIRGYDVIRAQLAASALIVGAGTMGLLLLALGLRSGTARVDVAEPSAERRERAVSLGCSAVAATIAELDRPGGWDVVIDATGSVPAIASALGVVAAGGTYLQFGVAHPAATVPLSPYDVYRREITVTGSMAVLHSFGRALDLLTAGVIDPRFFNTDRVPLDRIVDAFAGVAAGRGIKTQVVPPQRRAADPPGTIKPDGLVP
jgi:2-desacetyl-2-hydroxyethyl bacteriochlorophyllide A dehydrogenase